MLWTFCNIHTPHNNFAMSNLFEVKPNKQILAKETIKPCKCHNILFIANIWDLQDTLENELHKLTPDER